LDIRPLPGTLLSRAQTVIDPTATRLKWLTGHPSVPDLFTRFFDLRVPLDYCIARLIERYRLPWTAGGDLRLFLLTNNPKYLKKVPTIDVIIETIDAEIGTSLSITVDRVDEYTTRKQWPPSTMNGSSPDWTHCGRSAETCPTQSR